MPKSYKQALSVKNVSHPNSRKAARMMKQTHRQVSKEKNKVATYVKQNILGEKLLWFRDNLPSDDLVFSKDTVNTLLKSYLSRFDSELEQIQLKHSIGQRKGRQHASREDTIQFTQKRELNEYNTCGLEMPNLLDAHQVKLLREWNGELRFIQQLNLVRLGRKHLEESSEDLITNTECDAVTAELEMSKSNEISDEVPISSVDKSCSLAEAEGSCKETDIKEHVMQIG